MALSNRTKLGIVIGVAVLVGLTSFSLAVVLLAVAVFLIVWGQEPKRTEEFVGGLPGGKKALAQLNIALAGLGVRSGEE